jgi:hypothetical protein
VNLDDNISGVGRSDPSPCMFVHTYIHLSFRRNRAAGGQGIFSNHLGNHKKIGALQTPRQDDRTLSWLALLQDSNREDSREVTANERELILECSGVSANIGSRAEGHEADN